MAVNLRYVSSRIQALTDKNTKLSKRIDDNLWLIMNDTPSAEVLQLLEIYERHPGITRLRDEPEV